MKMAHSYWIFPLNIVIFHSYVSLPEGMLNDQEGKLDEGSPWPQAQQMTGVEGVALWDHGLEFITTFTTGKLTSFRLGHGFNSELWVIIKIKEHDLSMLDSPASQVGQLPGATPSVAVCRWSVSGYCINVLFSRCPAWTRTVCLHGIKITSKSH